KENAIISDMVFECYQQDMAFALMLDPWICKNATNKEQAVLDSLTDAKTVLGSPAYSRDASRKPIVLGFVTGADLTKLRAARPDLSFWEQHVDYTWPQIKNPVLYDRQKHLLPTMKLATLCLSFLDAGWIDPVSQKVDYGKSAWWPGEQAV